MCIFSDAYHFYKAADWSDMESYESDDVMQNNNGIIQQEVYSHLHRLPALPPAVFNFFPMCLMFDLKLCRSSLHLLQLPCPSSCTFLCLSDTVFMGFFNLI